MDALRHVAAIRKLDPTGRHRMICTWIERELRKSQNENGAEKTEQAKEKEEADLRKLTEGGKYEYEVRGGRRVRVANRREAKLVLRYGKWLRKWGRSLRVAVYHNLRCDAYEPATRNLIEAKSSNSREAIRMAVGQLLDYSYQGRETFGEPNLAVLLPNEPERGDIEWLSVHHISVIWEERGSFVDNASGRFTEPKN